MISPHCFRYKTEIFICFIDEFNGLDGAYVSLAMASKS